MAPNIRRAEALETPAFCCTEEIRKKLLTGFDGCARFPSDMSFELRPATRQGVRPLIALYSESGCGKTYSSLLLARGFVGPSGKIAMIDTESGRGSLYADVLPGGYQVLELDPPFEPRRYCEAMEAVEKSGASIGIVDSGSHEWEGAGGVLDMAGAIEDRTGKSGLHCWKEPKLAHGLWVRALLRSRIAWIVCLRAKYKSRQIKDEHGKTKIVRDEHVSPIAAEDFIFEATAHAEILPDHSIVLTKCSHPGLRTCFPEKGPITVEHGKALAAWCAAGGTPTASAPMLTGKTMPPPAATPKPKLTDAEKIARWKARLIEAGGGKADYAVEWAVENGVLLDTEGLEDWPASKLPKTSAEVQTIIAAIRAKSGVSEPPDDLH